MQNQRKSPAGSPCRSAPLFGSVPVAISSPGQWAVHGDAHSGDGHGGCCGDGDGGHSGDGYSGDIVCIVWHVEWNWFQQRWCSLGWRMVDLAFLGDIGMALLGDIGMALFGDIGMTSFGDISDWISHRSLWSNRLQCSLNCHPIKLWICYVDKYNHHWWPWNYFEYTTHNILQP